VICGIQANRLSVASDSRFLFGINSTTTALSDRLCIFAASEIFLLVYFLTVATAVLCDGTCRFLYQAVTVISGTWRRGYTLLDGYRQPRHGVDSTRRVVRGGVPVDRWSVSQLGGKSSTHRGRWPVLMPGRVSSV